MTAPQGIYEWLALAGAAFALLSLLLLALNSLTLRRLRRAQKVVLAGAERDIVAHAEELQLEFASLRDWLEEVSSALDKRASRLELGLEGAITHTAMYRYDAFGARSGRQSSSVALLDSRRSGVVLTAIVSRDFSQLYVKNLRDGGSDIELSPEELHAVELAFAEAADPLAAPVPPTPPAPTRIVTNPPTRPPEPPGSPKIHEVRQTRIER